MRCRVCVRECLILVSCVMCLASSLSQRFAEENRREAQMSYFRTPGIIVTSILKRKTKNEERKTKNKKERLSTPFSFYYIILSFLPDAPRLLTKRLIPEGTLESRFFRPFASRACSMTMMVSRQGRLHQNQRGVDYDSRYPRTDVFLLFDM